MANKEPLKAYLNDLDLWIVNYLASHPDAVRLIKEARQSTASGGLTADMIEAMREACDINPATLSGTDMLKFAHGNRAN